MGLGKLVQTDANGKTLTKEDLKRIKPAREIFTGTTKLT